MKAKVSTSEAVVKIPIEMKGNLPFVAVEIGGKTYNFLFDTGAGTVITPQLFQELHLSEKGKMQITDSQSNKSTETIALIPELKLGSLVCKNVGCMVVDFKPAVFQCLKIDGIIGTNLMQHLFWKVNYREKYIEATDKLSLFKPEEFTIKWDFVRTKQKRPILISSLYDQKIGILFDTGASSYINISKKWVEQHKDSIKSEKITFKGKKATGIYGVNQTDSLIQLFKPERFKFSEYSLSGQPIATSSSSLIGNDFLEHYVFILDWKNQKIHLKELEKPRERLRFPFGFTYVDGKFVVMSVLQTENQPLQVGDIITSINGQKLSELSEDERCMILTTHYDSDSIRIEIVRGDQILPFEFERKDFFKAE
ncbi:MAG: aspartyl protease family protein [Bacteroidota bacterium]|nr:aspartyl protease family protein [Bacteroidota bacterium]